MHSSDFSSSTDLEGDISPSLADPALLSVVGVVDGQFTGFITKEEGISSTKHQPTDQLKERDL